MPEEGHNADINDTMRTFGHPDTLVAEYEHWVVLLRPKQATLGAMVLVARGEFREFGALPSSAHGELASIVAGIEKTLRTCFRFDKINYLMLMMVDPHVHFHVVPRYAETRIFDGAAFDDPGWPRIPDMGYATEISDDTRTALLKTLRDAWPKR